MTRAVAEIDHSALAANIHTVRAAAPGVDIMAVVKADAYGHGAVPVAATARQAGASWLGVALPGEALELRHAGDRGRILAWLWSPGDPDLPGCIATGHTRQAVEHNMKEAIRFHLEGFAVLPPPPKVETSAGYVTVTK
jgi:alanine racemase